MDGLEQFMQDPATMVVVLIAGAVGAMLVLFVALFLIRGRDRELRALRVDHSLERDRRSRLEVEKETLDKQVIEARNEMERIFRSNEEAQEQLNETRNQATRLEAERNALVGRLGEAQRERDVRERERDALRTQLEKSQNKVTELETQVQHGEHLRQQLENAEQRFREAFDSLSGKALEQNREQMLADLRRENSNAQEAVGGLVKPVAETLERLQQSQTSLDTRISDLRQNSSDLEDQTRRLVNALRRPEQRGRWGELQLRRCVELAGMQQHVDFFEQEAVPGGGQRPDMIVHLPNNRVIVVDAKTPMDAYLSAWETQDEEERSAFLQQHAEQVRRNLDLLSQRRYQESFEESPDFVVMFLPGEVFYSAALEQHPALFEHGMESRVLIATPTILIALLRSVHMGWREAELAREAEEIGRQGQELYRRASILVDGLAGIRKGLDSSVKAYNKAVGSLNSRFIPQVQRFRDLHSISGEEVSELESLPADLRRPRKMSLKSGQDDSETNGS
ncbi:MAG: DNA recombination protein RmuC [Anaerolineaceae bacterium]|nr:DNA recombination protein RmuC [Anaerolineaceae bacterium]